MVHRAIPVGSTKAKVIFAFAICFVAIQTIVPTIRLSAPRPAWFGWQMYSGAAEVPTFWLVTDDGTTIEVDLDTVIGKTRYPIDYRANVPPYLCETEPHAVLVRFERADSSSLEEYPCR